MPTLRTRRYLRVKLDMVGRCQLRCIMCHFSHPEFQESTTLMDEELLEKVAADLETLDTRDAIDRVLDELDFLYELLDPELQPLATELIERLMERYHGLDG